MKHERLWELSSRTDIPRTPEELRYAILEIIGDYLFMIDERKDNVDIHMGIIGALESAKFEFYRKKFKVEKIK